MITGGLSKSKEKELYARLLGSGTSGRKTRDGKGSEVKVRTRFIACGGAVADAHLESQLCYVTVSFMGTSSIFSSSTLPSALPVQPEKISQNKELAGVLDNLNRSGKLGEHSNLDPTQTTRY
jgi:hypothetical protein